MRLIVPWYFARLTTKIYFYWFLQIINISYHWDYKPKINKKSSKPDSESGKSKGIDFFLRRRWFQRYLSQLLKPKEREVTAAAKSKKSRFLFFSMPYQKLHQNRQNLIRIGQFSKKSVLDRSSPFCIKFLLDARPKVHFAFLRILRQP